jgi:hypothetical protein
MLRYFQDSRPFGFLQLSSRQFIIGIDFFYVGYEWREIFQNSIPNDIKVDVKVTVNQAVA